MKNSILLFVLLFASIHLMAQGTFTVSSGASVKSSGNVYIVLDSTDLQNNGSLQMATGDGTVKFTGASDATLSGSGTTALNRLHLAKTNSSNLLLQSNIAVGTEVNFNGGLLNLGSNVADLGSTGALTNESEGSRAFTTGTGYIQANGVLNAPVSVNIGNLGTVITSSADMGNTTIKRGNQVQVVAVGNNSIRRYYDITPTNNTGLNATLRFHYFDAEGNNLNEATLALWKSADQVSWNQVGSTTRAATANYVEKIDINDFSRWTLAQVSLTTYYQDLDKDGYGNAAVTTQASALPVGYSSVSGDCNDGNATIHPGAVEVCGNRVDDNCNGLTDENCLSKPTISINSVTVYEAQGQATLTLTLSQKSTLPVSVYYSTKDGSAISKAKGKVGKDYTAGSGTVTIPAGALSTTIVVLIDPDNAQEGIEQFYVDLSKAVNATITPSRGTVTILNGTAPVVTSVTSVQLNTNMQKEQSWAESLSVRGLPNPSTTYFTLIFRSNNDKAVSLRIVDAVGRMVEGKSGLASNSTHRIGHNYIPGVYYAQVLQGNKTVTVKLVKTGH